MVETTLNPNSPLAESVIDKYSSTCEIVISEYNDLKEKLKATEEELENAKNEAKEWEDRYTKLVHQNNINEATIRSFNTSCGSLVEYFNHVVKGIIVKYNESDIISNFHMRDFSDDNMDTVRLIHRSKQVEHIGVFIKSLWTSKKSIAKRTTKRLRKMYKKFILNGG